MQLVAAYSAAIVSYNPDMRVLVACEFSGIVRDAFRKRGHDAISCDLKPSERDGPHILGNALDHLDKHWDLLIAHPPCTFLAYSGLHHMNRDESRQQKHDEAIEFAAKFLNANIKHKCIEQPRSSLRRYKLETQRIQPWQYGDDASKETWLWLTNLPLLRPTTIIAPRKVGKYSRWGNQADSGHPLANTSEDRSRTFPGVAEAMADQWGEFIRKYRK